VVTAEPLPSRLASLGFGTGDIDAVYHICFEELAEAVRSAGSNRERMALEVLIEGDRLRDYNELASVTVRSNFAGHHSRRAGALRCASE